MAYVSTEVLAYAISKIKSSCDDNYTPLKNGLYTFSDTETYNTGMFVVYDDGKGAKLYTCNTDATTGAWVDIKANFTEVGLVINDSDNASDSTTLSAKQINKLITDASFGAEVDLSNYAEKSDVFASSMVLKYVRCQSSDTDAVLVESTNIDTIKVDIPDITDGEYVKQAKVTVYGDPLYYEKGKLIVNTKITDGVYPVDKVYSTKLSEARIDEELYVDVEEITYVAGATLTVVADGTMTDSNTQVEESTVKAFGFNIGDTVDKQVTITHSEKYLRKENIPTIEVEDEDLNFNTLLQY